MTLSPLCLRPPRIQCLRAYLTSAFSAAMHARPDQTCEGSTCIVPRVEGGTYSNGVLHVEIVLRQVVRFWLQHLVRLVSGYPAVALARGAWAALVGAAAAMLSQTSAAARCAPAVCLRTHSCLL